MNSKIKDLMDMQLNKELEAAYLYLEFSNFFDSRNLDGYANYYKVQAKEEIGHALRFYKFLHDNKQRVNLMVIHSPNIELNNIEDVLEAGIRIERDITRMINTIYEISVESKDYASKEFIEWFIDEQFFEEKDAQNMINDYMLYKNNLYELNKKYSERK